MAKTGTKEWAPVSRNICIGCDHGCLYCFARCDALRFGKIKYFGEWGSMRLVKSRLEEKPRNLGRIMFPTTHDILPKHIDETMEYLRGWLAAGNEMLVVTKPHLECVAAICDRLREYRDKIIFRFTIGSMDDDILGFWEPHAPCFVERSNSLALAFSRGFRTSVSCEPFLDDRVEQLVGLLDPYVTDTIWIGKMNKIAHRVYTNNWKPEDFRFLEMVKASQTDAAVRKLHDRLKGNPKVRWKDSIKHVLGLPEEACG